jgi:hypothetical protein
MVPYTAVCNGFFQHLAAMGAKAALYAVVKECYLDTSSPLYGCRPWLFAHDEIGLEIPYYDIGRKTAADAAMRRLSEIMVEVMSKWVPDVPVKAEGVLCRRWYKGAEPAFDGDVLVPSKPVYDPVKDKTIWVADMPEAMAA